MTIDDKLKKVIEQVYEEIKKNDKKKKNETFETIKLMLSFTAMNILAYIFICLIILLSIHLLIKF